MLKHGSLLTLWRISRQISQHLEEPHNTWLLREFAPEVADPVPALFICVLEKPGKLMLLVEDRLMTIFASKYEMEKLASSAVNILD